MAGNKIVDEDTMNYFENPFAHLGPLTPETSSFYNETTSCNNSSYKQSIFNGATSDLKCTKNELSSSPLPSDIDSSVLEENQSPVSSRIPDSCIAIFWLYFIIWFYTILTFLLPSFQILDFDDSIYDENEECIGVKEHVIQEEEECQPIYENSPKEKTISSRFKTSTPVESLNDVYKTCLDPRLLHASSPVHTCPIFMYGDYSPPAADQYCRFSSVPRAWFSTHQPMGDRDAVTLHHLVFRPNGRDYFSPTFGKHCNNAPYFLDYIRLFPAASVEFDRTKLEFFKLLPLNADVQEGDTRDGHQH